MLPSDREFGNWLELLLPDDGGVGDVLAMLTATVDESGTHKDAPVLCVAACLALPHEWKRFRKAWRPVIAHLKKPYHATEHKKNPKKLNEQLAALIQEHVEICIAVTVPYAEYQALTTQRFRSALGSEYSIGVFQATFQIERWAKKRKKRWVAYVFEEGHKNSRHVKQVLGRVCDVPSERRRFSIYSQTWLRKDEPILHPPDLVAFEVARSYGQQPTPIREQLGKQIWHHHMTREEIVNVVAETTRLGLKN